MILTLSRIEAQAGNAVSFIFTPREPFSWIAGQSIKIAVPGAYGPIEHRFTISSAPSEKTIAITTRPSSSEYKQVLFNLTPGDVVDGFALEGNFVWRNTSLAPIFIAAGIGITPFHSILKEQVLSGIPLRVTLIYGTSAGHIVFEDELDTWASTNPGFTVNYLVGERVSVPCIMQQADGDTSLFYLSGPSAMVDDLSAALIAHGVLESQLIRDWFIGRLPHDG
jgi:ferredoxin-NADP reductase